MKRSAPIRTSGARRRARQRGISLVEVVVSAAVIGLALLSHAASTLAGHRLSVTEENRGIALEFVREFIERMRGDEDWTGLYARLRTKVAAVEAGGGAGLGGVCPEGQRLYDPLEYYADLLVPHTLRDAGILVQVPYVVSGNLRVLREDLPAPHFGLPYDIDGDGVIDANSHETDYVALPVVVSLRWEGANGVDQTIRVATWLRGDR